MGFGCEVFVAVSDVGSSLHTYRQASFRLMNLCDTFDDGMSIGQPKNPNRRQNNLRVNCP